MKIARARTSDGIIEGTYRDGVIETADSVYELGADATFVAPVEPGTFYCIGRNYAGTIDQMEYEIPDRPDWFIKSAVSLAHPDTPITYPSWTSKLTYAGELAAVIDTNCSDLANEDAVREVIRGWTIMNDLDALDQDGRTARKAFTGSAPIGPVIETELNPCDLDMETHISGEQRQEANTAQMLFDPYETIAFLSERYTFRAGDVIAFGSPPNPGELVVGDDIEIWYEGIGTLRNSVVSSG